MNDAPAEDPPVPAVPAPGVPEPLPRLAVGAIAVLIACAIVFVAVYSAIRDVDGSKSLFILSMLLLSTLGVDAGKWLRRGP